MIYIFLCFFHWVETICIAHVLSKLSCRKWSYTYSWYRCRHKFSLKRHWSMLDMLFNLGLVYKMQAFVCMARCEWFMSGMKQRRFNLNSPRSWHFCHWLLLISLTQNVMELCARTFLAGILTPSWADPSKCHKHSRDGLRGFFSEWKYDVFAAIM